MPTSQEWVEEPLPGVDWSFGAADGDGTEDWHEDEPEAGPWRDRFVRRCWLPIVLVTAIGVIAMINHFSGVDWGDDFALYMRQAKAVTTGSIGDVLHDNRFAVDNSGWNTFSPYSYPWGWPLLVAPFYAVFGLNYEVFKVLEVLALCTFLAAFFAIVRRRGGVIPATLLVLVIGLSPSYLGATDTVLSDLPYLGFVGLTLWWIDRCRLKGQFGENWRLVVLGLLLAYTYSVRREGIVLVAAVVAAHLSILARQRKRVGVSGLNWRKAALPYAVLGVVVVLLRIAFPTALMPDTPGAGVQNVSARVEYYTDVVAEHVGLKDLGGVMQLFGSPSLADNAMTLIVVLAGLGVVLRLKSHFREDIAIAVFFCCSAGLMLVSPYQESRYFFTITPFLLYFAYQALPSLVGAARLKNPAVLRVAVLLPALGLGGLLLLNARDVKRSTTYHLDYHYTVHGPESPDARQMFSVVEDRTGEDDVILFFRARAMTLYTDRLAIQGSNLDQLLPRSDWYVMAKGSTYSQALLNDQEAAARGLVKEWENGSWVLWRVAPHQR